MTEPMAGAKSGLRNASILDTAALIGDVVIPTLSKGVIIRRPRLVALAERLGLDSRTIKRLQRLRGKYGSGPLLLAIPVRWQAVILSPEHVHRVLEGTPHPFSAASAEKRATLAHFEPDVSLISRGPERTERRRLNEKVLESGCLVHSMAPVFLAALDQEARRLLSPANETLTWEQFNAAWQRIVRRVVLGDRARDDENLKDLLDRLRRVSNWAFLHPKRKRLREEFLDRLRKYIARGEQGSLADVIARMAKSEASAPADQISQYLFAFDAAGIATFRALALLASHPEQARHAREEIAAAGKDGRKDLPFIRACVRESLRLWPTTPAILRETTEEVRWDGGVMPKNTNILIFTPYFHRDDENLSYANRFTPELWLGGEPDGRWPLIPFSDGPGICPGRNLVALLASAMTAAILDGHLVELDPPDTLRSDQELPGTLDYFSLRFKLHPDQA